jgi:hypothetical protein
MSYYQFGVGGIYVNPTTGNLATPSGPIQIGVIQDCSVEFDQKLVELRGQGKLPDDVAPADLTGTFKSAFGKIDVNVFNNVMFGETITAGISVVYDPNALGVPPVAIPATPYEITPTIPGSGTFVQDMGVQFANGQGLNRVASAPATGEYSVAAGVYTFAAADTTKTVYISYVYSLSDTGQTLTTNQHIQGYGPVFEMYLLQSYQGQNGMHLHACRSSKTSAPLKRDGYMIPAFEGQFYADANGVWFDWFQADSSF